VDKQTLRRIGWIGTSLGLTSALIGCNALPSDASSGVSGGDTSGSSNYLEATNGLTDLNGLGALNGLNAMNGLNITNGFQATNGFQTANGLGSINGFNSMNGFNSYNGFNTMNGFQNSNGLNVMNGLNISNGLNTLNGLASGAGYMTSEHGRMIVQYMARCALASGDSLVKQDQNGVSFTYPGGLGLAPGWKNGGCNRDCAEMISACMMAHINSSGTHIPLWMDSPDSVGWGTSTSFPTREGTFFGELMVVNGYNNVDGYYCYGPGADQNVVPGRLGANQGSVPYADAWPTSAGMDGLCETSHVVNGYDHGNCVAHTTNGVIDGDSSCTLNGQTYNHPLTVWRGATYQAEAAEGGGFDSNGNWQKGMYGFNAGNCNTPGQNGCAIVVDANNGMGKRVGYIGPSKGVKFTNVSAPASTSNIIVYYTNGDAYSLTRYLSFIVNGSAAQVRPFGGLTDWSHPRGAAITLSGFKTGSSNTIYVTADPSDPAPDLDWIEVVGTTSTVPQTGLCEPDLWNVTTNIAGDADTGLLVNGKTNDRWTSNRGMQVGDYVQIDFQGSINLSTITLDNSNNGSGGDYPGTYAVYTSQDGTNFSAEAVTTGNGAQNKTTIQFPQESLRAIRIKVTGARSPWWSIGEVSTDCNLDN
jgi:hypothetical protein